MIRKSTVGKLLLIALLAEIAYAALNISTMPVYLQYDRGFGASVIGLVIVAFLMCEALFKGPMGAIADRVDRRYLIILGPAISIVTTALTLALPRNWGYSETIALIALRALDGIGAAALWPAAFALVGDSVEDDRRQHAMSLLNMCYLVGVAVALPLSGFANDVFGQKLAHITGARSPALIFAAALFAIVVALAAITLPKRAAHGHTAEENEHSVSIWVILASVKTIPMYLALSVITFIGVGFPMAIIKLFSEQELRLSESQFGVVAMPAAIAMALLSVPMSKFGERIGRARAVHVGLAMCTIGMGVVALGTILPFMRTSLVLAVGVIPVGMGFLLTIPAWMASVSDIDPKRRAVNLGAIMTAQGIGAMVGMPLGSLMYEKLQPLGISLGYGESLGRYAPFAGCAAFIGIGWAISLRTLRPSRAATPEA